MKKLKKIVMASAAVFSLAFAGTTMTKADNFINGADISILDEMEQSGAIYKINGKQQDPLTILKIMVLTMFACDFGLILMMQMVMPTAQELMI